MKKIVAVLLITIVLMLAFSSAAFAADPTYKHVHVSMAPMHPGHYVDVKATGPFYATPHTFPIYSNYTSVWAAGGHGLVGTWYTPYTCNLITLYIN